MHIAIILQYYHTPDCPSAARPYALVERLARDHEVTVITTQCWRKKRLVHRFSWVPPGVRLVEFDVPYDNAMGPLERLLAFARYAGNAFAKGLQLQTPDLIIGSSTPLTAAMAAQAVASLRGVPWIFEVRDLWPEFPIQMGAVPCSALRTFLYGLETRLYRSATAVVTLSTDMERHVCTVAPNTSVTTLEYGSDVQRVDDITDERKAALRREFSLDRRFLVLYAGTFGRANAIPTLLNTAKQLSDRSDLLFAFAGRGYYDDAVQRTARQHDHVRSLPPLPYPKALTLFALADLSIVSFLDRPVLSTNSPGKLYDSLATGTPVVVTNPGWTKRLVDDHDCGWYVPPESPNRLTTCLRAALDRPDRLQTLGQNARSLARRRFRRADLMDQYANLVDCVGRLQSIPSRSERTDTAV